MTMAMTIVTMLKVKFGRTKKEPAVVRDVCTGSCQYFCISHHAVDVTVQ